MADYTAARIGMVQLVSGVLVLIATWIIPWMRGSNLTSQFLHTIHCALVMLVPSFLLLYSSMTRNSPAWRAFARGLLSIPLGAAAIAFFAITLGAPIAIQDAAKTLYWSLFMSTLMVAPAATILGTSWSDWQRIFAFTKPSGLMELSICIPVHGAAVGAWVGAWPMPLDWDREWQEWPISCTYGAIGGYLLGLLVASLLLICKKHGKTD